MALKVNNSTVSNVLYNGIQLNELQLNGVTVWTNGVASLSALNTVSIVSVSIGSGNASEARYEANSDGNHYKVIDNDAPLARTAYSPKWLVGGSSAQYEMRVTRTSGDNPNAGDSLGVWLSMSTNRAWICWVGSNQKKIISCYIKVEVRVKSTQVIVATATNIRLIAEVNYSSGGGGGFEN